MKKPAQTKRVNFNASRKRLTQPVATKVAAVRETRVMLYGSRASTEVQESIRKIEISGRKVELASEAAYQGAYPGDKGPTMGMGY